MNQKVLKHLEITFTRELKNITNITFYKFSSRPLDIESKDDFYILSNGLIVAETSLEVFDHDVYDLIEAESIPMFIRATVANWMAKNITHWFDIFKRENSGTHMA